MTFRSRRYLVGCKGYKLLTFPTVFKCWCWDGDKWQSQQFFCIRPCVYFSSCSASSGCIYTHISSSPTKIQAGLPTTNVYRHAAKTVGVILEDKTCVLIKRSEKSDALPDGKFSWIRHFRKFPDEYVLNHQSLDGYLFLRFLKMACMICFVGCCITWPVLFPVNATGGAGKTELDILSFANISENSKNRYYAHALLSWVFFGISNATMDCFPVLTVDRLCNVDDHKRDIDLHQSPSRIHALTIHSLANVL